MVNAGDYARIHYICTRGLAALSAGGDALAPQRLTLHLDPVRSAQNLLIVLDVLGRTARSFPATRPS